MGDSTPLPSPAAIARAELFTREQFVYEGEALEEALAPGSARRRALDAALGEVEAGAKVPSIEWRRQFSLLLGLERLLSEEEPHLVDGTVLSAHQVDALSGTLTALLAEAQRNGNGNGAAGRRQRRPARGNASAAAIETETRRPRRRRRSTRTETTTTTTTSSRTTTRAERRAERPDDRDEATRSPQDWQDENELDEDELRSTSSPRTPTPTGASGSNTRPVPARLSRRSGSWRARAPAAS